MMLAINALIQLIEDWLYGRDDSEPEEVTPLRRHHS
jgi:hypothetical protein